MEEFKINNYEREHGTGSFPGCKRLDAQVLQEMRRYLAAALGIGAAASGDEICRAVQARSQPVEGVNAEAEGFDLGKLLSDLALLPAESVYLNWYRYDDLDVMRVTDVIACFSDIWYPSSDDLDILDPGLCWILSISHYGAVRIARVGEIKDSRPAL